MIKASTVNANVKAVLDELPLFGYHPDMTDNIKDTKSIKEAVLSPAQFRQWRLARDLTQPICASALSLSLGYIKTLEAGGTTRKGEWFPAHVSGTIALAMIGYDELSKAGPVNLSKIKDAIVKD